MAETKATQKILHFTLLYHQFVLPGRTSFCCLEEKYIYNIGLLAQSKNSYWERAVALPFICYLSRKKRRQVESSTRCTDKHRLSLFSARIHNVLKQSPCSIRPQFLVFLVQITTWHFFSLIAWASLSLLGINNHKNCHIVWII